jgi:hypothetical protein
MHCIGVGIVVLLVALSLEVLFLFFRRYRQAYARRKKSRIVRD